MEGTVPGGNQGRRKGHSGPALTLAQRAAKRLKLFLERERIVKNPGERIYAWRTIPSFPDIYAPGERERLQAGRHVHEQGRVCNILLRLGGVLTEGLLPRRERTTPEGRTAIDAVIAYADRYGDAGLSAPCAPAGGILSRGAERLSHPALFAVGVKRLPQYRGAALTSYMWPFSGPTWKRA